MATVFPLRRPLGSVPNRMIRLIAEDTEGSGATVAFTRWEILSRYSKYCRDNFDGNTTANAIHLPFTWDPGAAVVLLRSMAQAYHINLTDDVPHALKARKSFGDSLKLYTIAVLLGAPSSWCAELEGTLRKALTSRPQWLTSREIRHLEKWFAKKARDKRFIQAADRYLGCGWYVWDGFREFVITTFVHTLIPWDRTLSTRQKALAQTLTNCPHLVSAMIPLLDQQLDLLSQGKTVYFFDESGEDCISFQPLVDATLGGQNPESVQDDENDVEHGVEVERETSME